MKAILTTEMPSSCNECVFRSSDDKGNTKCYATLPRLTLGHIDGMFPKHVNCPLKPIPQKKEDLNLDDWVTGFNDCLDEILGETE